MYTSNQWISHFKANALQLRVDWNIRPSVKPDQLSVILPSLQAWQLGETSDGKHLLRAASLYAGKIKDPDYIEAVALFIKEEQKHGNNLGRYLDAIGKPRIKSNWGDTLFRRVRYFNTSMEIWTLAVIVVESTAQIFYQSLKNATDCMLLKQICTDILIDESYHIDFQTERFALLFDNKSTFERKFNPWIYQLFFFATACTVWIAHKDVFKAGGNTFRTFMYKMKYKYIKTIMRATSSSTSNTLVTKIS